MLARLLKLSLVLFVLSFCVSAPAAAHDLFDRRWLPTVKAKMKGQHHVHRPNYRRFRAYRQY